MGKGVGKSQKGKRGKEEIIYMAEFVLLFVSAYCLGGVLYGIYFITRGVLKFDPISQGSPRGFRFIILPGTILLWPFLIYKGAKKKTP